MDDLSFLISTILIIALIYVISVETINNLNHPIIIEQNITINTRQPVFQNNEKNNTFDSIIEEKIWQLTNQERTSKGLKALNWNDDALRPARYQSQCLAKNNLFAHETVQCGSLQGRLDKFNIKYPGGENLYKQPYTPSFEQIYQNNVLVTTNPTKIYSQKELAETIVAGWMNSTGHRENILNANYTDLGVGVYEYGNYYYATQVFLSKTNCGIQGKPCCNEGNNYYGCYQPNTCNFNTLTCERN